MKLARNILGLAVLTFCSSLGPVGSAPAAAAPPPQIPQLTPEMLSGLRLRNIGPPRLGR